MTPQERSYRLAQACRNNDRATFDRLSKGNTDEAWAFGIAKFPPRRVGAS
jgi:hypothetical protein